MRAVLRALLVGALVFGAASCSVAEAKNIIAGGRPPAIPLLPAIEPGTVVLEVGDSLLHGFFNSGNDSSYRLLAPFETWMTNSFTGAGKTPATILNTAVSGQTSSALYAGLAAQVTSQAPDVVFLLIGSNDVSFGLSYDTTRLNIHNIIADTLVARPNCKFFVISLLLLGEHWPKGQNPGNGTTSGDGPWDLRNAAIYDGLRGYLGTVAQWIYVRDALFDWLALHNAPNDIQGWLTTDQEHPTKAGTGLGPQSGSEVVSGLVEAAISLNLN